MYFLENVGGFSVRQPDWGPGRNDTFTNNKIFLFGEPWRKTMPDWWTTGKVDPENIGIVDWPSIWLQGPRKKRSDGRPMQLHWDGNNDMVEERNLNASMATSALPPAIDHESIECIEQWLETLTPPAYRFPIDAALAKKGEPIYVEYCAECHGRNGRDFDGKRVGFVTPIDRDRHRPYRLNNYTETLALNMATTYAEQKRERRPHRCPGGTTYQPPMKQSAGETEARVRAPRGARNGRGNVSLQALSQDQRLREHAARRHLAAGPVSAQRIRAHPARPPDARRQAAPHVLSRQRCL